MDCIRLAVSLGLAASLVACGAGAATTGGEERSETGSTSAEQTEIVIAHADNPAHPKHRAFERFAEVVEKASDGRITATISHSGALGDETELVESVKLGSVTMTSVSNGVMVPFAEEFMLLDVPFQFEEVEHARSVLDGEAGKAVLQAVETAGLTGLAFWEQGFRNLSSGSPVQSLDDVQGLKVRTLTAPLHVAAWNALGANATPMSWGEVFTSLQQGVIDGQENPLFVILQENLYEVQDYATLTRHIYDPMPVVVNSDWFDGLDNASRQIVLDAMEEATQYERDLAKDLDDEAAQELADAGFEIIELAPEERARFKERAQPPVLDEVEGALGEDRIVEWLNAVSAAATN